MWDNFENLTKVLEKLRDFALETHIFINFTDVSSKIIKVVQFYLSTLREGGASKKARCGSGGAPTCNVTPLALAVPLWVLVLIKSINMYVSCCMAFSS